MYLYMYVSRYSLHKVKLVQLTTLYDYELRTVCKNHHERSNRSGQFASDQACSSSWDSDRAVRAANTQLAALG